MEKVQVSWELAGSFLPATVALFSRISSIGGRTKVTQGNERRGAKNSDVEGSQTWHKTQVHLGDAPTLTP